VGKCDFLSAFYLDFDESGLDGLHYINENLAVNQIAWLVEGKLSLNLDFALLEDASRISEQKHR